MANPAWVDDLNHLLVRFSGAGICPDTYTMEKRELWALYCGLRRLADAGYATNSLGNLRGYQ